MKIKIKTELRDGNAYQAIVRIGDEVLHFPESDEQIIDLAPRKYSASVAGFQDPSNDDSEVTVTFLKNDTILKQITISDRTFIKLFFVNVN